MTNDERNPKPECRRGDWKELADGVESNQCSVISNHSPAPDVHPASLNTEHCLLIPSSLFNRRGDDVAVFSPTAVVVLHVVEAEQIFQHEPGVARTFADAAISDSRFLRINALLPKVNPLQLIGGFEGAVLLHGGAPGDALGAGDVA